VDLCPARHDMMWSKLLIDILSVQVALCYFTMWFFGCKLRNFHVSIRPINLVVMRHCAVIGLIGVLILEPFVY